VDNAAGTLAVLLAIVTLIGILAAPLLISLFAPGFLWEAGQYQLAVQMLRITFPYLLFISLTAFAGAILNAHGKFAVPAVTPVFLNISMILAAIWLAPLFEQPILALSWGVLAAGIVQLAFQLPALWQLGLLPRPRWGWRDSKVRHALKLMSPAMFAVSVVQVNLLFDTLMASFLASGSVSWLYYSDRLVEFPLGIFGVAVATVVLPHLSEHHVADDPAAFTRSLNWGLRLVVLVGLPATLGLVLLSQPLVSALFQYNEFSANDAMMASKSLMAFAAGLLAFMLIKLLVSGFSAQNNTRTPVRFGLYSVVSNVILNLLLIVPLAHAGVALATSLSAYLNAGLLLWALLKARILRPGKGWWLFVIRVIMATAIMSAFLLVVVDASIWPAWNAMQRGLHLTATIVVAMLIYAISLVLLGIRFRDLTEHEFTVT
jgi:putative peptidoglycan lipid II flippase